MCEGVEGLWKIQGGMPRLDPVSAIVGSESGVQASLGGGVSVSGALSGQAVLRSSGLGVFWTERGGRALGGHVWFRAPGSAELREKGLGCCRKTGGGQAAPRLCPVTVEGVLLLAQRCFPGSWRALGDNDFGLFGGKERGLWAMYVLCVRLGSVESQKPCESSQGSLSPPTL